MEQWGATVARSVILKGFLWFLLPPSYKDLQAAARHGPVIILIASQYSCSTIIVPTSGKPRHVPLPSVTLADLKDRFASAIWHPSVMGTKGTCLEDLYICSYTPTLSALVRSRPMMKKRVPPSFMAIRQTQPVSGKGKALLAVDSEIKLVRQLVPVMTNRTTISGDAVTPAGALQASQENT
ncbi:uncharacterized protein BJ212DRAFT_1483630 [Suillus subaureus]|uniref:Uncharacterized protein n=1 Tax=Suillus subaureus TaxID=48587 RepID=A0A9P7E5N2_9AGAM|nr:uncharacterized protein BJ212DRAFT_1483630 [Suillus subaureus]KAG1811383.1 hypothetical protein BJ212DRAFT_1483630 [Suillus subaureus]